MEQSKMEVELKATSHWSHQTKCKIRKNKELAGNMQITKTPTSYKMCVIKSRWWKWTRQSTTKRSHKKKGEKPPREVMNRITVRLTILFILEEMMSHFSPIPREVCAQIDPTKHTS